MKSFHISNQKYCFSTSITIDIDKLAGFAVF